jgi:hypothetical protein
MEAKPAKPRNLLTNRRYSSLAFLLLYIRLLYHMTVSYFNKNNDCSGHLGGSSSIPGHTM